MEVIRQLSPPSSFHLQRYKKIPKLPNFFPTFFHLFSKKIFINHIRQRQPILFAPIPTYFRRFPPDTVSAITHRLPPFSAITRRLPPDNVSAVTRRLPPDFRRRRVLPRVRPPAANVHGEIKYTGCGLTRGKTLQRRGLRYENTRHIYCVAVLHEVRPYDGGISSDNRRIISANVLEKCKIWA